MTARWTSERSTAASMADGRATIRARRVAVRAAARDAAVLALCVVVHLATIIYAVRHGLTSDAIVARMHAKRTWPAFYTVFVIAVAIHAPLGFRAIADEWLGCAAALSTSCWPVGAGAARRRSVRGPLADAG